MKTVMVADGGARGHSIAWLLSQSPQVGKIYVAPGNPGTAQIAQNIGIAPENIAELARFAQDNRVDFTVFSSDTPLINGAVDEFRKRGLGVFGCTKAAAAVEGSKRMSKEIMKLAHVPTAKHRSFGDYNKAYQHVRRRSAPMVIKASGNALGKGSHVCMTRKEALEKLKAVMVDRINGSAGEEVVIEDYLEGPELSVTVFKDAKGAVVLPPFAQDHKETYEGSGVMTGGLGVVTSPLWLKPTMFAEIMDRTVSPMLRKLDQLGRNFTGCFFPGLKFTPDGFKVLEYNARPGDPEWPTISRLFDTGSSDFLELLERCMSGSLEGYQPVWRRGHAASVVLAAEGYPDNPKKGMPITGIEDAEALEGVVVFHAGTKMIDGQICVNGGRVLLVTAVADSLEQALARAYSGVRCIKFDGMWFRTDIGRKSLALA